MKPIDEYIDKNGKPISIVSLDQRERDFLAEIKCRAMTDDANAFVAYAFNRVPEFYKARGVTNRREIQDSILLQIAEDLATRLDEEAGLTRDIDYRDQIRDLISTSFSSRKEFCDKTGLDQTVVCKILKGERDVSVDSLSEALSKIGYVVRIMPSPIWARKARKAAAASKKSLR